MMELASFAIVTTWIALRLRRERDRASFALTIAVVAAAAFVGEDSSIRLYHFYAYAPSWHLFIDQVPLAIVCIWPVVILSSIDLARQLTTRHVPVVAALLVLADASLIEPIATTSALWTWTEPGPFHVPIIGIFGWSFFAFGVALTISRPVRSILAGPLASHALLLATWWLALRWLPRGTDALPFVVVAWLLSTALTIVVVAKRIRIDRADLLARIPAASFFFVLLAIFARDELELVAYAIAFAPPYLALTALARASPPRP